MNQEVDKDRMERERVEREGEKRKEIKAEARWQIETPLRHC